MRIVSWNVNGLYNTLKDASVRYSSASHYLSQILKADIVCFQEAKIQEEKLEKWMACISGYESFWAFSKEKKGYSGVVTYVKDELTPLDAKADCLGDFDDVSLAELCNEGRLVDTDHGSFVLINVYAPNAGEKKQGRLRLDFKLNFLQALKRKCDELICLGRHVVIVGDFNVAHEQRDVHKKWNIRDIYSSEELAFVDAFFTQYVDLFRHFHPDAADVFSVWNQKTEARIHNEGVRIDYALCDKGFVSQVLSTDILKMVPKNWSDHAAVVLTLKDQPMLPVHARPAISSYNMKQFQEDFRQKKLTTLFSSDLKGKHEIKGTKSRDGGSPYEVNSNVQGGPTEFKGNNMTGAGDSTVMAGNLANQKVVAIMIRPKLVSPEPENPAGMPVHEDASRNIVETFSGSHDRDGQNYHDKAGKEEKACIVEECEGSSTSRTEELARNFQPQISKQSDPARPKRRKSDESLHSRGSTYKTQKVDSKSASNSVASSQSKQRSLSSYFHRDPG